MLSEVGKQTEVFVRFSTVAGGAARAFDVTLRLTNPSQADLALSEQTVVRIVARDGARLPNEGARLPAAIRRAPPVAEGQRGGPRPGREGGGRGERATAGGAKDADPLAGGARHHAIAPAIAK